MFFILNLIVVVSSLFLFILVFLKNHRSTDNKFFLAFILSIIIWVVISSCEVIFSQSKLALVLVRFDFGFGCLISLTFFLFSLHFQNKTNFIAHFIAPVIIFAELIFFGLSFSNLIVASVTPITNGLSLKEGVLFLPYAMLVSLVALSSSVLLFHKMRRSTGYRKTQIRFVLTGLVGMVLVVLLTNLILPKIVDPTISNYGVFGFLIFIGFTSYAIVKYRFMDIRLVIIRSIVFTFLIFFVTGSFVLVTYIGSIYISQDSTLGQVFLFSCAAFGIVVFLDPFKKFLARLTNSIFYKASINYNSVTKVLTNIINEEIELSTLVTRFSIELENSLRIEYATILLPVGPNFFIEPEELVRSTKKHSKNSESPSHKILKDSILVRMLYKSNTILIIDEVDRLIADSAPLERQYYERIRAELEKLSCYALLPIVGNKKLEAIIFFSNKLSGEAFSHDDIQLFDVIAPQIASGIQKAELYQQAKEFSTKLQHEVEKATADLREANKKLTELDVAKSEFMSIASHQLRTPLAGIVGYLSMIDSGDFGAVNKEQAPVVKDILEATKRLIRMVNIFLNVTRIEAGRFVLNYTTAPFHDVIEAMYKELKPTADAKHVQLTYTKTELPVVEADVDKMKDVILNLIDNAIKYSPKGAVSVTSDTDGKVVHVMVKDTGVGIEPVEAKNLFSKFVRGSGIARVEPNGSGLGLFIAKKIVEEHGGRIWVESEGEGKGSTFQFEIPLKADKDALKKVAEMKARVRHDAETTS